MWFTRACYGKLCPGGHDSRHISGSTATIKLYMMIILALSLQAWVVPFRTSAPKFVGLILVHSPERLRTKLPHTVRHWSFLQKEIAHARHTEHDEVLLATAYRRWERSWRMLGHKAGLRFVRHCAVRLRPTGQRILASCALHASSCSSVHKTQRILFLSLLCLFTRA